jgi:DNA-directed RNA polymerase subunit RPC12/RpoP
MPRLKNCECWRCKARWQDFPGRWAKLTQPQFQGDTRNGCPNCGHLYWAETDCADV